MWEEPSGQCQARPRVPGDDLYLTIDLRLQKKAEESFRKKGLRKSVKAVFSKANGGVSTLRTDIKTPIREP